MEKPFRSKQYVIAIEILAIVLVLAGFGAMALFEHFQKSGYGDFWFPLAGLIALGVFGIGGIALLIYIRRDAVANEINDKEKKLDALPLKSLTGLFPDSIEEKFLSNRFVDVGDGFLRRKMFSPTKDSVCYYVKHVQQGTLQEAFEQCNEALEQKNEPGCVCLLLFLSRASVQDSDLEELRGLSKVYLITETTLPTQVFQSFVPIIVDSTTNEGRFLDTMGKYPISVYTHGCKLLNKYFA